MPNWVKHSVELKGNKSDIETLLNAIKYDEDNDNEFTGVGTIDFNKIIPMPKSLNIECGSRTTDGLELYLHYSNPATEKVEGIKKLSLRRYNKILETGNREKHFSSLRTALTEEDIANMTKYIPLKKLLDIGRKAANNIWNYGCSTWYEWSIVNWGTKWNSTDCCSVSDDCFEFSTAWSPALPVLSKLSEQFPEVEIKVKWADEDIGNNCGKVVFKNGETLDYITDFYMDLPKSIDFAKSVWGWED